MARPASAPVTECPECHAEGGHLRGCPIDYSQLVNSRRLLGRMARQFRRSEDLPPDPEAERELADRVIGGRLLRQIFTEPEPSPR